MLVLILRSARALTARQSRTSVRASRRIRTATGRRPHASRRIAAHLACGSACARRAAMLLSMRARVRRASLAERSQASTNLRLYEIAAGTIPLFPDCYLQ